MRCAYIASRYPYVSHTFILREVLALRERGVEVSTVTVRRPDEADVIAAADREEMRSTHAILPASAPAVLRAHRRALGRSPRAYFATLWETLRDAPPGAKATLWQLFYFAEAMMLWEWLGRRGLGHVHAHHANVASDLAMIASRFERRLGGDLTWSFTLHGPTEFGDTSGHKLGLKGSSADAVVAISEYARDRLAELVEPARRERIAVIHCGIDPDQYAHDDGGHDGAGALRVLAVGRLEERKGNHVLLEALAELRERGVAVDLTLVGDGPERERLEQQVDALGLRDSVTFLGALGHDEVTGRYADADLFCLASFAEGTPIVLMEAMASRLPVVSTAIAGIPELVDDGRSGLLVTPGDAAQLATAIGSLAGDPELRRRMGEAGRERVRRDYTVAGSAAALEQLFAGLIGPARPVTAL